MKIAVLHRYPITEALGTNASFLDFLKELNSKKVEVSYVTYKELTPTERFSFINYLELPFTFDRWNNKDKLLKTILWTFFVPVFLLIKNKKTKFDLIYCDDSVPYYGFLTKILNPNTKVFIRLGDLQSGYAWADKNPRLFKFVLQIEKFMWKKMDGIVAISESFKKFIIEQVPTLSKKVFVVEESVNLDNPLPAQTDLDDTCTFLFHGALLECKGVDLLIRAFADFSENNAKVRLIIAGGGPEESRLRKLATDICPNKIEFTGKYNHSKLKTLMEQADVSIVMRSTNMANNFVVTTCLLENWSFKKPVLAPDLESFMGVINDNVNGILFKAGNQQDLVSKLNYIYNNQSIWESLGSEGYLTAKKAFSHKEIAKKMATVLISSINNV